MAQLRMRWKNDGTPAVMPKLPPEVTFTAFPDTPDALNEWLDIVQYGLSETRREEDYYDRIMRKWRDYDEKLCFFLNVDGKPMATITVICHRAESDGYVHMVAARPEIRGRGYGNLLNEYAVYILKREGMAGAFLTTDDFRIPAIKSYLRMGFEPDKSTAGRNLTPEEEVALAKDFDNRWDAIFKEIGRK